MKTRWCKEFYTFNFKPRASKRNLAEIQNLTPDPNGGCSRDALLLWLNLTDASVKARQDRAKESRTRESQVNLQQKRWSRFLRANFSRFPTLPGRESEEVWGSLSKREKKSLKSQNFKLHRMIIIHSLKAAQHGCTLALDRRQPIKRLKAPLSLIQRYNAINVIKLY